jgi:sulfur-oxidizing protein SoxY
MQFKTWSHTLRAAAFAAVAGIAFAAAPACAQDDETPAPPGWDAIRKEFYDGKDIIEKDKIIIEAPDRAEDAAVVPVTIHIGPEAADNIKTLRIFVDNNPMPMVGTFTFGHAAGIGSKTISTRVRFDTLSDIRAIAETHDGKVYMGKHFVQASGGCSSPAIKDAQAAEDSAGVMNVKTVSKGQKFASSRNQSMVTAVGQVMLKHPNYSGMQMDPVTGEYIPAKYVKTIDVSRAGELVFHLEAGISLSTNPNLRFTYGSVGNETLEAKAEDSDGAVFNASSPPSDS